MKITFNTGFPKGKKKLVENAIPKAMEFIRNKYPTINFDDVPITFSSTRNGSNYLPPSTYEYRTEINNSTGGINIATHGKLHLYKKVTIGLTTPHGGLLVGCELQVITSLIHELTHFVQGIEKRLYSEVETTTNEIEYLKLHEPFWYGRLVPIK